MSSRQYWVDQEIEIYNFGVDPDLQISKRDGFLMIYIFGCLFPDFFVMDEVFWRFGELSSMQGGSGTQSLQV